MSLLALMVAVDGNDVLTVELIAGGEVQGYPVGGDEDGLTVTWDNRRTTVPWELVDSVQVNGEFVPVPVVKTELLEFAQPQALSELWAPPPLAVGAASLIWPGAGHLLLGDRRSFLAYSGLELALIGVAAWEVHYNESLGPLIPLVALDLVFRVYSAVEATDEARERRTAVRLSPPPAAGLALVVASSPENTLRGWLD